MTSSHPPSTGMLNLNELANLLFSLSKLTRFRLSDKIDMGTQDSSSHLQPRVAYPDTRETAYNDNIIGKSKSASREIDHWLTSPPSLHFTTKWTAVFLELDRVCRSDGQSISWTCQDSGQRRERSSYQVHVVLWIMMTTLQWSKTLWSASPMVADNRWFYLLICSPMPGDCSRW